MTELEKNSIVEQLANIVVRIAATDSKNNQDHKNLSAEALYHVGRYIRMTEQTGIKISASLADENHNPPTL